MSTTTKKELIERIAKQTGERRTTVKNVIQSFLNHMIHELSEGKRLEFRDFGVFETKYRAPRTAQNPKTLERVEVPAKRTVKFKIGRLMKMALDGEADIDFLSSSDSHSGVSIDGESDGEANGQADGRGEDHLDGHVVGHVDGHANRSRQAATR